MTEETPALRAMRLQVKVLQLEATLQARDAELATVKDELERLTILMNLGVKLCLLETMGALQNLLALPAFNLFTASNEARKASGEVPHFP